MKNINKIIFVIIGTIIGAGFASGKEIYLFFGKYGVYGILGIFASCIIIGIIISQVLKLCHQYKIQNYGQFISIINTNKKANEIIKIIVNLFLLISFYIMIAGFSAYFSQELKLPSIVGTMIILGLCYLIFMGNMERLIKINTFLVPILIICIMGLILKNKEAFSMINYNINTQVLPKTIWNAILYASYNTIILIPILVSLQKWITNEKQIKKIGILCTLILVILAVSIYGILLKVDLDINKIELPTVYVAGMLGITYKYIYGFIILVSIYTSAISAGYGVLENAIATPKKYKRKAILMCASSVFISSIGFSNLINVLYPVFGILGLIQIFLILKKK